MNRIVFVILALLMSSIVKAQDTRACKDTIVGSQYRTCVIADMETHVPVRDVIIHTDNGHWARSDYRGYWNMRYTFDSASVKREGYLETKIYSRNLPDTLFLLPKTTHTLDEVTVYGKDYQQQSINQALSGAKKIALECGKLPSGKDFLGWMDARGRRDAKHLKKAKEISEQLDGPKSSSDPVIAAYEKTKAAEVAEAKRKRDEAEARQKAEEKTKMLANEKAEIDKKKQQQEIIEDIKR